MEYFSRAAVRDNKTNVLRTALQTRVDFPFEVDLWSLGVTLYQCATGLIIYIFYGMDNRFHFRWTSISTVCWYTKRSSGDETNFRY